MEPYFRRQPLRFECTECGACCTGGGDRHVYLADGEARAICDFLGLSWGWFQRRYLARTPQGERVLRIGEQGDCVFLQENRRCGIYGARPVQCRSYPFWPELVSSKRAWHREQSRCEGIDRGRVVPLEVIEAALKSLR